VVVVLLSATMIIAGMAANSPASRSAGARPTGTAPARPRAAATRAIATANAEPALVAASPHRAAMTLVLTAVDHQDCPAAAAACVDLGRRITWLQAHRKLTFGPIQMEPGKPGSTHQTPRGTFWVQWKAGPTLVSNIYHEPMPWAVFFAAGGIAFHGGSLTTWSHGCVHLTIQNAHYYNQHLPIGAEVVVF
jgi:hypothetical protein